MVAVATATIEDLRAHLKAKAPFLGSKKTRSTGDSRLDQLLGGGFPEEGLTVLSGRAGSGRSTVAARFIAAHTDTSQPAAWIDPESQLYPPALLAHGVDLDRLLVVRGVRERGWYAAEQVIDSGAFSAVVVVGGDRELDAGTARRLQLAAEGARVSALLVVEPKTAQRISQAALTLHLTRGARAIQVDITRDRSGAASGRNGRIAA